MAEPNGREAFEIVWRPLIGVGLVLAFGVQSALPYVSPMLIVLLAVMLGLFYHMSYSNFVDGVELTPVRKYTGIGIGFSIIVLIVIGIVQAGIELERIRPQCERLKKELLLVPDSTKSDTYTALRCPSYNVYAPPLVRLPVEPGEVESPT